MNLLLKTLSAAAILTAAIQIQAASRIYTCEINGQTVYTSRASSNCRSADLPEIGRYSSSRYDRPVQSQAAPAPEPPQYIPARKNTTAKAAVPKPQPAKAAPVMTGPKTVGSNSRRAILEQELANERKALSDAQKSLAQARSAQGGSIDRQQVSDLQSNVLDRQQNIQALQRELGRM